MWGESYKITSTLLSMSPDSKQIERSTYNALEWLGDLGGLIDALRLIGAFLVAPLSAFKFVCVGRMQA